MGYTKTDIKRLFASVRSKKLTLNMVGYGGTSVNTMHWLYEMSKMVFAINTFKQIKIWEPDTIEVSNLLRFPIDTSSSLKTYHRSSPAYVGVPKTDMANGELERLSTEKPEIHKSYLTTAADFSPYQQSNHTILPADQIVYGAPDITTRQRLAPYGNFISATHSDSSCRIDLNPEQDDTLQVESYGMISLSAFFMNQLRMAIGLLELLGSDQDLQEQDKTILEYKFTGERLLQTDREYQFQLEHSGLVLTPEEADQNV